MKCFYQTGCVLVVQHECRLQESSGKFDNLESTRKCNVFRCPNGLLCVSNTSLLPDAEPVSSDFFIDFSSVLLDSFCCVNCCNTNQHCQFEKKKKIYKSPCSLLNIHRCADTAFVVQYEAMQHSNNTASLIRQFYTKYKLLLNIHQCAATTALSSA